jgi:hypothetical protein
MYTRNQQDADAFDLKIFNLIRSAEEHASGKNAATMKEREQWETIARTLGGVRSQVRRMMHQTDLAKTA